MLETIAYCEAVIIVVLLATIWILYKLIENKDKLVDSIFLQSGLSVTSKKDSKNEL